jgi:carboxyl-terminal processing protease
MKGKNTKIEVKYLRQGVKYSPNHSWWSRNKIGCIFSKIDAKTGYIGSHLIKKASYETKQAEELKRQGAERIILDLRGNPEACSMKR